MISNLSGRWNLCDFSRVQLRFVDGLEILVKQVKQHNSYIFLQVNPKGIIQSQFQRFWHLFIKVLEFRQ